MRRKPTKREVEIASRIDLLIGTGVHCDCTLRESCEVCRIDSPFRLLVGKLYDLSLELKGFKRSKPTLEDYGRVYTLTKSDLERYAPHVVKFATDRGVRKHDDGLVPEGYALSRPTFFGRYVKFPVKRKRKGGKP